MTVGKFPNASDYWFLVAVFSWAAATEKMGWLESLGMAVGFMSLAAALFWLVRGVRWLFATYTTKRRQQ